MACAIPSAFSHSAEPTSGSDRNVPPNSVLQANPFTEGYDLLQGIYSNRQMGMKSIKVALAFGGNPKEIARSSEWMNILYERITPMPDVDRTCRLSEINYLLAAKGDRVWERKAELGLAQNTKVREFTD